MRRLEFGGTPNEGGRFGTYTDMATPQKTKAIVADRMIFVYRS
jgi:hypothetical protein